MKMSKCTLAAAVMLIGVATLFACASPAEAPSDVSVPSEGTSIPPTSEPSEPFSLHQEGYGDMGSLPATRGTWKGDGLVQDGGAASDITFITGDWAGFKWESVHGTALLASDSDDQSSISLKMDSDFTNLTIGEDGAWQFEAEGRFFILSGTGNYAGLHGEGSVKTVGTVEFLEPDDCPVPNVPFCPVLKVTNDYEGEGYID